jgi:hypothetical protein
METGRSGVLEGREEARRECLVYHTLFLSFSFTINVIHNYSLQLTLNKLKKLQAVFIQECV